MLIDALQMEQYKQIPRCWLKWDIQTLITSLQDVDCVVSRHQRHVLTLIRDFLAYKLNTKVTIGRKMRTHG